MNRFNAVFATVCVLFVMGANAEWQTDLNKDFKLSCPHNQTLQKIESNHDNMVNDKLFNFRCVDMPRGSNLSDCEWSDYMKDYKQMSVFQCDENGVLTGVESAIYGRDRKYRFKCCTVKVIDLMKGKFLNDDGTVTAEGDMRLTQPQFQEMYGEQFVAPSPISKRGLALRAEKYRWPNGIIPYHIKRFSFSKSEVTLMKRAMKKWEEHTCLKFRPRRIYDTHADKNYIAIVNRKECSSYVGMQGGRQEVDVVSPRCQNMGTLLHELGHAIGLSHEHKRPDRDKYVHVDLTKVKPNKRFNFVKYSSNQHVNTYGTPYDYSSIMHYRSKEFSKDRPRSNTILTKDKSRQHEIRTAPKRLSYSDVKIVNLMYKCNQNCPANPSCKSPGYLDKDCCCVSPKGVYCGPVGPCINRLGDAKCNWRFLKRNCSEMWNRKVCSKACGECNKRM